MTHAEVDGRNTVDQTFRSRSPKIADPSSFMVGRPPGKQSADRETAANVAA